MSDQPDTMENLNEAQKRFQFVQRIDSRYCAVMDWTPVIVQSIGYADAVFWLEERGLRRGDGTSRNDWMLPLDQLFIIKDPRIAMEFKLTWA